MKFLQFLITSLFTVGIAIAFSALTGQASAVNFPADYQTKFFEYATVDCPKSQIVRKMYVNREVIDEIATTKTAPSGTVIAMETHSARIGSDGRLMPYQLNNVFVREKKTGWRVSNDSGEWQSAWYGSSGNLVSSSQGSCISCHTMVRDRDYLFTLPALLKATNTGQMQYQKTEFGTSVCQ